MESKRKCQVHLIETNKAENCILILHSGVFRKCYFVTKYLTQEYVKNYLDGTSKHFYITSDETIKEGDYCLARKSTLFDYEVSKYDYSEHNGTVHVMNSNGGSYPISENNKIIATTDKLLNLPQPSPQFIEKYCQEYNKGNMIKEVMVEYTNPTYDDWMENGASPVFPKPKIDSHNYITITRIKDSWSREEVEAILDNIMNKAITLSYVEHNKNSRAVYAIPKNDIRTIKENL
jgi:hypothetical protein